MTELTQEKLKELLDYDHETGVFTWKKRNNGNNSWNAQNAGRVAGTVRGSGGAIAILLFGHPYKAHILAWIYHYGIYPEKGILHLNMIKTDNRVLNLEQADFKVFPTIRKKSGGQCLPAGTKKYTAAINKDGTRVISKGVKRYIAVVKFNGKTVLFKRFKTKEESDAAYLAKKQELYPALKLL